MRLHFVYLPFNVRLVKKWIMIFLRIMEGKPAKMRSIGLKKVKYCVRIARVAVGFIKRERTVFLISLKHKLINIILCISKEFPKTTPSLRNSARSSFIRFSLFFKAQENREIGASRKAIVK
jgi:hypothetical protein